MLEILIFTSTTCGICRGLVERIDDALDIMKKNGIDMQCREIIVDIDDNYLIAGEHSIFAIPTIIVGKDRKCGNLTDGEITDFIYKAALLA